MDSPYQDVLTLVECLSARWNGTVLPADFGELIVAETEKWGKVIKFAGIKPE